MTEILHYSYALKDCNQPCGNYRTMNKLHYTGTARQLANCISFFLYSYEYQTAEVCNVSIDLLNDVFLSDVGRIASNGGLIVNNDIFDVNILTYFKILYHNLMGRTENNLENISVEIKHRSLDRPENETGLFSTTQQLTLITLLNFIINTAPNGRMMNLEDKKENHHIF
jgi:hypothetical protein